MRKLGLFTLIMVSLAGSALAQDKPPVMARAEACLAANADAIAAAEPDINSAASFLLNYACAAEVTRAARYEQNVTLAHAYSAMFGAMSKMTSSLTAMSDKDKDKNKGGKGKAGDDKSVATPFNPFGAPAELTVDPETGDIVMPKPPEGAASPFTSMMPQIAAAQTQLMGQTTTPVSLRKLAGDLILAAHIKHAH